MFPIATNGVVPPDSIATGCSDLSTSVAIAPVTIKATLEWRELPSCGLAEVTMVFHPASVSTTMVLR